MSDPILDEIWRVRAQLLKQYGGLDGYLTHVQKLDRAHRRRKPLRQRKLGSKKREIAQDAH
jgi:hypothetical protein